MFDKRPREVKRSGAGSTFASKAATACRIAKGRCYCSTASPNAARSLGACGPSPSVEIFWSNFFGRTTQGVRGKQMITQDQQKVISLDSGVSAWVDTHTGLVWEVKNQENFKYMYVWSKSRVNKVADSCKSSMEDDVKDCESYIKRLNSLKYSVYDDWRISTIIELITTLNKSIGGSISVKPHLSRNCMRGTWSDTPAMSVYAYRVTGDWRNEAHIPTILVLDLSKMSAVPYDPSYTLWIRAVRAQ
jgi:hypothetical protein